MCMCVCRGAGLWLFSGARGGQFSFGSFTASVAAVALLFHSDTSLCPFLCVTISVSPFGPVCHLSPTPLFLAFKAFLFPPPPHRPLTPLLFTKKKATEPGPLYTKPPLLTHSAMIIARLADSTNAYFLLKEKHFIHSAVGRGGAARKKKTRSTKAWSNDGNVSDTFTCFIPCHRFVCIDNFPPGYVNDRTVN